MLSGSFLPVISGTMQNYLKNTELKMKFEQQKQNPAMPKANEEKTAKQREIEKFQEDLAKINEGNKTASLDIKLWAGGELTDEELQYLKQKNPELYQRAMDIKEERRAYKKALERCRTKEEVDRVHTSKILGFMSDVKIIQSNAGAFGEKLVEQINCRMAGISSEQTKFIKSTKYRALPTEQEFRKGKRKKKEPPAVCEQKNISYYKIVRTQLKNKLAGGRLNKMID
ncbi:hypothetical protein [Desulfotomaculum sp. 1211_IL3151]|uniref:hypothetical protein n=1 Tax=Desulfotomaculum sp. 1211_IL3151 TaxID=3084055 RepID=UPI002FDAE7BD